MATSRILIPHIRGFCQELSERLEIMEHSENLKVYLPPPRRKESLDQDRNLYRMYDLTITVERHGQEGYPWSLGTLTIQTYELSGVKRVSNIIYRGIMPYYTNPSNGTNEVILIAMETPNIGGEADRSTANNREGHPMYRYDAHHLKLCDVETDAVERRVWGELRKI